MEKCDKNDKSVNLNLEQFVKLQAELLDLERACEVERAQDLVRAHSSDARELEKRGVAFRRVVQSECRSGLYGRTVITFTKERSLPLPATNISNGDIVGIFSCGENSESVETVPSGVVTQVTPVSISVSFDESDESLGLDSEIFNIIKLANDVTHKRLKSVLDLVSKESNFSVLHDALFARTELSTPLQNLHPNILNENGEIKLINANLNDGQKDAVKFSLLQRELAIVHGPPGTGKTTTVVELILQEVAQGHKVLCCAPSNVAVDNLLEKLAKHKIRVLRLGHPARLNKDLVKHSLDAVLSYSDESKLVDDVRRDLDKSISSLKRSRGEGEKRKLRNEIKELRKEIKQREIKSTREILSKADVVLSTLVSASLQGPLRNLPKDKPMFDVTVIDECSQALEISCWIALLQSKKTILAGDHLQLPPTIMSEVAAAKGLSLTLMERAIKLLGKDCVRMLNVQYRMNEAIMNWSSKSFYDNKLVAHESVSRRLLKDLSHIKSDENTDIPLLLIDTSGCDLYEAEAGDEISKANEGEAALVCIHAKQLIESGLDPADIAIITPYNLQVELIRLQLSEKYPTLEIRSVDGFQGREKEAVILSLVRSNNQGEIGFLSEHRRLNVAVTRGKRHVAVICNVECISNDNMLKTFAEYLQTHGEVRTALQYQHLLAQNEIVRPQGMELVLNDSAGKQTQNKQKDKNKQTTSAKDKQSKAKQSKPEQSKSEQIAEKTTQPLERPKLDEEMVVIRKAELVETVKTFLDSIEEIFDCSPDLSAHDRKLMHEIAEELNLYHESQGEGSKRHIVLSKSKIEVKPPQEAVEKQKPKTKSEQRQGKPGTLGAGKSAAATGGKPRNEAVVVCSGCLKEIPKFNIELHKMRCTALNQSTATAIKKPKSAKTKESLDFDDEEEIDKLLESFSKLDTVCNYEKCKALVAVMGVNCQFCKVRYCLGHGLPEAHGCGDAARRAARQQISRDGKLYSGSGRPDMKPDPVRKAQLQRKLDKKLNELEDDRKMKPKKK